MRQLCYFLILDLFLCFAHADYTSTSNSTSSADSNNLSTGNNGFANMVQQQTNQALQIFQNVNYQKLSGNQSQNDFFTGAGDDDDDSDDGLNSHAFDLFKGN